MAYSEKVVDHYEHPRNVGSLPKEDPNVGTGLVGAPECGDVMRLQMKINPVTQIIEEAKFKTFGCGSAIASSSLATEWIKGRTVDDALALLGDGWVSAGGDLATAQPIVVGLPGGDTVLVDRGGLATSSVSKRSWLRGGERQHHLIDPATGAPARTRWSDVTVAAPTCLEADIAAKAALLLGDEGPSWLDRRGLAGRFVDQDGCVVGNQSWTSAVPAQAAA